MLHISWTENKTNAWVLQKIRVLKKGNRSDMGTEREYINSWL